MRENYEKLSDSFYADYEEYIKIRQEMRDDIAKIVEEIKEIDDKIAACTISAESYEDFLAHKTERERLQKERGYLVGYKEQKEASYKHKLCTHISMYQMKNNIDDYDQDLTADILELVEKVREKATILDDMIEKYYYIGNFRHYRHSWRKDYCDRIIEDLKI